MNFREAWPSKWEGPALNGKTSEVARVVLTASGGPFRGRKADELAGVTREQALRHPTWQM